MRDRITARVLLFDAQNRILLMKARLPSAPEGIGAWFTVGGGVEPGESLVQAALREVAEETGLAEVALGPVVWLREAVLALEDGEAVLFKESYLVARCPGGEPSRAGWQALEHAMVDDMRWWTLAELAATDEPVYPEGLSALLGDIAAGCYPPRPVSITVRRG